MPTLNILLAVDDSEAAQHACRLLAGYAGDRSALRVTLLNVQRPPLRLSAGVVISASEVSAPDRIYPVLGAVSGALGGGLLGGVAGFLVGLISALAIVVTLVCA